MNFRWTDTLAEPLASLARGGAWSRVERARTGGWLLLAAARDGDATSWHHAPNGATALAPVDPLDDARLPQIPIVVSDWLRQGHGVQLWAWRVGSRAVFRVTACDGPRICKVYRKDRRILDRWTVLADVPGGAWRVPRVLGWDPRLRLLTLEECPGVSLNRRWLAGQAGGRDGDRIAAVLEWLGRAGLPDDFPQHDAQDEARLLEERLGEFRTTLADPPDAARALTGRVTAALRDAPTAEPCLCHRDFHDKQILVHGDGGSLVDLDLAASGPPALDVGNILAHLRLRALKGAALPWAELAACVAGRARSTRELRGSLPVWTASALLRLALIYARRRRGPELLERLFASAGAALERGGEWRDIV